jgi:hypothetical protein
MLMKGDLSRYLKDMLCYPREYLHRISKCRCKYKNRCSSQGERKRKL